MKTTKREKYQTLIDIINTVKDDLVLEGNISFNDLLDFLNREINLIDGRAEKAAKKNKEKRELNASARELIYNVLVPAPMTADDVLSILDNPEFTRQKVVAGLGKLARDHRIVKTIERMKCDDGRTHQRTVYSRPED